MKKENIYTKYLIIGIIIAIVLAFVFFNLNKSNETIQQENTQETSKIINQVILNIELKDIRTQETFKISDFSNKPVLLESFAVWCPTCTRQQQEIKKLHDEIGDEVISISLDTDPFEDESIILQHLNSNGFNWYYAISPVELTQALIDEFGVDIVNAPQAPVVLICDGEKARQLGSGIKSVDKLKEEIEKGC